MSLNELTQVTRLLKQDVTTVAVQNRRSDEGSKALYYDSAFYFSIYKLKKIHTHTHTHTYIYIYMCVCVCVCVCVYVCV